MLKQLATITFLFSGLAHAQTVVDQVQDKSSYQLVKEISTNEEKCPALLYVSKVDAAVNLYNANLPKDRGLTFRFESINQGIRKEHVARDFTKITEKATANKTHLLSTETFESYHHDSRFKMTKGVTLSTPNGGLKIDKEVLQVDVQRRSKISEILVCTYNKLPR